MEWLNTNSAAIQALSSLVSLIIAGILATITWRYVKLTKAIADVAASQLRFQAEDEIAELHELRSQLVVLLMPLLTLPANPQHVNQIMEQLPSWDDLALLRFQALAAKLGDLESQKAGLASASIMWLRGYVDAVKASEPEEGHDWQRFPWDAWRFHLETAKSQIKEISTKLQERLKPNTVGQSQPDTSRLTRRWSGPAASG